MSGTVHLLVGTTKGAFVLTEADEGWSVSGPHCGGWSINHMAGTKPRGLCWHWAEDMERRLDAEGFRTLEIERAIANAFNPILIDHSTAVIVARGDGFEDGIVLDPWRYGGALFWDQTLEDTRYDWMDQQAVFRRKLAEGA